MHSDFARLLIAFIMLYLALFQFGVLCFLGQRVTCAADDLLDASYNCSWYSKDRRFKKMLMIIREMCQHKIEFGVYSFAFSHENFKNVRRCVDEINFKFIQFSGNDERSQQLQHIVQVGQARPKTLNYSFRISLRTGVKVPHHKYVECLDVKCCKNRYCNN